MNLMDIVVIAIMLYCVVRGYLKGFAYKFIEIISLIASLMLAWFLSKPMSNFFNLSWLFQFDLGNELLNGAITMLFAHVICFIILFVLFQIIFFVGKYLISKILHKIPVLSSTDKLAGAAVGFVQGFLILCIICLGLSLSVHNKEVIEETSLRYVHMIGKPFFAGIEDDLECLAILMDSIKNQTSLSEEQKQVIFEWLIDFDVEEGTAESIIQSLR